MGFNTMNYFVILKDGGFKLNNSAEIFSLSSSSSSSSSCSSSLIFFSQKIPECKVIFIFILTFYLSLAGNSGRLTWVRLQQPHEQRYPFLTVRAVFSCVQIKAWLPMLGIFNVSTDVNTCDDVMRDARTP